MIKEDAAAEESVDPSDDGKVINGSTIVWLWPPGSDAPASQPRPTPPTPAEKKFEKTAAAKATAATLKAAAKDGIPFCAECEALRLKNLAAEGKA